jgi:hypothetical protein
MTVVNSSTPITLTVFSFFSVLYLREPLRWNYFVGFAMIVGAGRGHSPKMVKPNQSQYNGLVRKGMKRAASNPTRDRRSQTKPSKMTRERVEGIRQRRENIRERLGILSDSSILIREDRER